MKQCIMIIGVLLISTTAMGQKRDYEIVLAELETKTGIERIRVLNELANQDVYNDQELCRRRAWEMIDSALVYEHQPLIGWGYRYVGLSYDFEGQLDSARFYYLKCLKYFDKPKDHGWSYFNIAYSYQTQTKLDSAEKYLGIAESMFEQDSTAIGQLGSVTSMKGDVAGMKGDQSLSLKYYLKASKYFEKAGDIRRFADAIAQVGEVYNKNGEHRKAIETQKNAIRICRENNEAYYECYSLAALGNSYYSLGVVDSAKYCYDTGLEISRRVNNDEAAGTILQRLASISADEGNVTLARTHFQESNNLFNKLEDAYSLVSNMERQARMEYKLNNHSKVINLTNEGIALAETQDLFGMKSDLLKWQSQSFEELGQYQSAFSSFKSYQSIQDSLNSKDRSDKLQELLVQYETEKKEKELIIVQAENDRKTANNNLLLMGLLGLSIAGFLVFNYLRLKQRKDRLILKREKELEVEKRKFFERELEFKRKELTGKTLQLARKNEFLVALEGEVTALKDTVDSKVKMSSERIRRMIQHDTNDDEDWNHFTKEFSTIHQEFIDKLAEKHGSFTTNDLRLVSLMKMNLSTKDIASTLRVSADGVKKARYRLRKKMGIESSIDLQEYLLNFG